MEKVTYNGKSVILNSNLIEENNVSNDALSRLKTLYFHKMILFEAIESIHDSKKLKEYEEKFTKIEDEIKNLWNFDKDQKYGYYLEINKM